MKEYRYVYESGKLPDAFRMIPLIMSLDEKYLKSMLASSRIREYVPGEAIVAEGEKDFWMYLLLSGRVRIEKESKEVAVLEHIGDVFGESAIVDGNARSASVVADRKTICLAVDGGSICELSEEDRNACFLAIFRLFFRIVAVRLKKTTEELARAEKELESLRGTRGDETA